MHIIDSCQSDIYFFGNEFVNLILPDELCKKLAIGNLNRNF